MKPVIQTIATLPGEMATNPNDGKDNALADQDKLPKMRVTDEKTHLSKQAELSHTLSSYSSVSDSPPLPGSNPVVSPRGQPAASEAASGTLKSERKIDHIDLANNVSLQIFSTDETKKNKNVILFLHGGPDLSYNSEFDNLTSWSLDHGYTLVAPEVAGSDKRGLAGTSDSFANPPNYVRDIQSVIQHLRQQPDFKDKEFCVVAHSWGGFQLASFLTDKNVSSEDKNFIRQVVFMSPNLDSAHTRIFEMSDRVGGPTFESELKSEMTRRHAGEKSNSAGKISFLNNPVMNKNINEEISPFYRIEQMPKEIPCLFVHPTKDRIVPVGQSLAAMGKINNGGGNAKVVMTTNGGHAFFKTGQAIDPSVATTCLGAIDTLIKNPESLKRVTIDEESSDNSDLDAVEVKIKEKDDNYQTQKNLLNDWHGQGATDHGVGKKTKNQVLTAMKQQKESLLKTLEQRNLTAHSQYKITSDALSMINEALKS